jgi:phenylacetate-coenzyme A ligase PaaK-like adenylate-forming protein
MSRVTRFRRILAAKRADALRADTERMTADERHAMQHDRLAALVTHAVAHSPFYARWYGEHGVGSATPLTELPALDKPTLMAAWDDVPVDRGLKLATARAALVHTGIARDHHVFQTGGSSGVPGVFAYDRPAVDALLANVMRAMRFNGNAPRLPRTRMSLIWAPGSIHMAARLSGLVNVGLYRMQALPASAPVPELAARLDEHKPDVLAGYATVLGLLAAAQLDGTLDIAPRIIMPSSEPLTPAIRERVRQAWGVEPFDIYATTETGTLAHECAAHAGLHIYEDTTIVEPQADGVLLTSLTNYGFPLIRFSVDDLVELDDSPCPCGRTSARLTSIAGRANDILELPSASGGAPVAVHPSAWTPITALEPVADAEIVQRNGTVTVRAVPRAGRDDAAAAVREYVDSKLAELGVGGVDVRFETVDVLPRTAVGKRKLVRRD